MAESPHVSQSSNEQQSQFQPILFHGLFFHIMIAHLFADLVAETLFPGASDRN